MSLLGAAEVREIAAKLDLKPTKSLGQNFVIEPNVCRKIVSSISVKPKDIVLEIGPGLGSLTLAIAETGAEVIAVEIDAKLAGQLMETAEKHNLSGKLTVLNIDALQLVELPKAPNRLVANLPYNVSVPVLLSILEKFPSIEEGIVMVQAEVADRLCAKANTKDYGVPSVKINWWVTTESAGAVSRNIFWPVPNVDSKLVKFKRHAEPVGQRERVFKLIDAAFGKRRKMLRSSLSEVLGKRSEDIISSAGIDPTLRGEALSLADFCQIAEKSH